MDKESRNPGVLVDRDVVYPAVVLGFIVGAERPPVGDELDRLAGDLFDGCKVFGGFDELDGGFGLPVRDFFQVVEEHPFGGEGFVAEFFILGPHFVELGFVGVEMAKEVPAKVFDLHLVHDFDGFEVVCDHFDFSGSFSRCILENPERIVLARNVWVGDAFYLAKAMGKHFDCAFDFHEIHLHYSPPMP